ncbi:MAG: hypoxanthine-guanine phosphoribosyltransferase [Gammaproteobacteria bacterium]|nr:hypoxanthine-guanine phosphoribosyltransferase [Gammaproteobacteria bacterium]
MSDLRDEAERVMREADCIHDDVTVQRALDDMAVCIERDLGGRDVVMICVMNGGLVTTAALMSRLHFALRVDYMHATRYRERTQGDELHWRVEPSQDLAGRHLLVVDDILDEGYTLDSILSFCRRFEPASLRAAVLVRKAHDRGVRPTVDYIGLTVPDRYVFGYGMDYKGYWRNAPGIFAVADQ